tara:strand:- start:149 stop:1885 length:1737 start_codon:yes stop_codon:yes gene_type:complete
MDEIETPVEEIKEKGVVHVKESNVVCALFVLIVGPVFDALCALPGVVNDDLPASLRTSCIVLVVLIGSPPIRDDGVMVLEQRAVLGILLAACSFLGLNNAEAKGRNADAVFAFIATAAAVIAVFTNGVDTQRHPSVTKKRAAREHLSAVTGGLFFYLGMRIIRHSFAIPSEISSFKVNHNSINALGYGIASEMVVIGNSFTGAISVGFACILLLNHDLVFQVGSVSLSNVAGTLSCFAVLGALFAQLAEYGLLDRLPALFSDSACDGTYEECEAAYRARRLFWTSNSTSTSWTCAIAMTTFAFAQTKRFRSRREHFEHEINLYSVESLSVLTASSIAILLAVMLVDPINPTIQIEIELVLLIASVPMALFHNTVLACGLHAAGQVIYVLDRLNGEYGFSLAFYTHHSLLATLALTVVVGCLTLFSSLLYTCGPRRLFSEPVEKVNAAAMTALLSVQFFLTLATLGMASGYTGAFYAAGERGWRSAGFSFTVQHCISFFFAAGIFATRYEHDQLTFFWRRISWFLVPLVLGIVWMVCVATSPETNGSDPYTVYVDVPSFVIGVSASTAAWVGVGVFLHV